MYTLNCKGRLLSLHQPQVMGIINITPDSFVAASRVENTQEIVAKAEKMLNDGAAIVDIGGQSTRPGATPINAQQEMDRVLPAIEAIINLPFNPIISIDTYFASVAKAAVNAGAAIVNDISGGLLDEAMLTTVAALQVPYVCMHMQGTPATMQNLPQYQNVGREVLDFFIHRIGDCRAAGIKDIIIDPGFGFGKTTAHNFELLQRLEVFSICDVPLLVGVSRKSMVYKTLNILPENALNGTTVLNTIALTNGAKILRVHDVLEAKQAIQLWSACQASNGAIA